MIESIEKPQESIRKNRNPHRVIPAQAGIQKHNAAGLYRKKPKPHRPSFPQKRESKNATQQESIGKNRNPTDRHSRKSWNPATEKPQESISKNRNPHRVIPAKAGIQKRNATGIYRKKQKPHRPSFPQKRESRPVGTESYRIKQFP
ncbi:putative phage associated protein [Neisseria meningitidis]|nr:putative phage associated protein [Neisseria meningitidis]CWP57323.1 putative phage associated protein [Neisseria meningitidis]CWT19990.1 putative phage associated protein [Neisseria meningitidis]